MLDIALAGCQAGVAAVARLRRASFLFSRALPAAPLQRTFSGWPSSYFCTSVRLKASTNMSQQAGSRGNALARRGGIPYNPLTLGWGGPLVTDPSPHECNGAAAVEFRRGGR